MDNRMSDNMRIILFWSVIAFWVFGLVMLIVGGVGL